MAAAARRHLLDERHVALQQATATAAREQAELEAFTYAVTHDLRPPLAGVALHADAILGARTYEVPEPGRAEAEEFRRLTDQLVVFSMGPDPEPHDTARNLYCQRAMAISDSSRPEATDLLEAKRRIPWIRLQAGEGLIGQLAHADRQRPEAWCVKGASSCAPGGPRAESDRWIARSGRNLYGRIEAHLSRRAARPD